MNWDYSRVNDVNDLEELNKAIEAAKLTDKPSIIEVKSIIGYGSKDQGKSSTHGAPIGLEETALMRKRMDYDYPLFTAPEEVYEDFFKNTVQRGETALNEWENLFEDYKEAYPELAQ
jgi:transketolase